MSARIDLQGIEPSEWDIDGGIQATLTTSITPEISQYYPRFGQKLAGKVSRPQNGTMTCEIPPVSDAGRVEVSLWGSEGTPVPGIGRQFIYKDRTARKVCVTRHHFCARELNLISPNQRLQLALKTSFVRLHGPAGHDGSQTPPRNPRSTVAELQETDQIATAITEYYGSDPNRPQIPSGSTGRHSESQNDQPPPEKEAKRSIEGIVVKALGSFAWTSKHDILAENTEHEQTFLHICAIGDYRALLEFLLEHGCEDPVKKGRRDHCGRTAVQLARAMERSTIEGMLTWGPRRDKQPPDVRGSDKLQQTAYAVGLGIRTMLTILHQGTLRIGGKVERPAHDTKDGG